MTIEECADARLLASDAAFAIYRRCMGRPDAAAYRERVQALRREPTMRMFVCRDENGLVGLLYVRVGGTTAEIVGIAVAEGFEHKGIGRALIEHVVRAAHVKCLMAQTDDDAVGFYRKNGFEVTPRVKRYPDGACVRYDCVRTR